MTNAGERAENRGPSCTVGGDVDRCSQRGKQYGDPWKKEK